MINRITLSEVMLYGALDLTHIVSNPIMFEVADQQLGWQRGAIDESRSKTQDRE